MQNRKPRVENPERCIRTRGLAAGMRALAEFGPHASLDRVAEIAGCPKASLARVFETKEALFIAALEELDRASIASMRELAREAGWGRRGALAAAEASAISASKPGSRGCPINSAGAQIALLPWAQAPVGRHKDNVIALYAEMLSTEICEGKAWVRARAIALIADGAHINAASGHCPCPEAALLALRSIIDLK